MFVKFVLPILFPDRQDIHYIGGADILPAPLEQDEENEAIEWLETEKKEEALCYESDNFPSSHG